MAKNEVKTKTADDGLRYKQKTPGSPFGGSTQMGTSTMSCFRCGRHRIRNLLRGASFLGKTQMVCNPSCKAVDEVLQAGSSKSNH